MKEGIVSETFLHLPVSAKGKQGDRLCFGSGRGELKRERRKIFGSQDRPCVPFSGLEVCLRGLVVCF